MAKKTEEQRALDAVTENLSRMAQVFSSLAQQFDHLQGKETKASQKNLEFGNYFYVANV